MMAIDYNLDDEHVRRRAQPHTGRNPETTKSATRHGPSVDRLVACDVDSNPNGLNLDTFRGCASL